MNIIFNNNNNKNYACIEIKIRNPYCPNCAETDEKHTKQTTITLHQPNTQATIQYANANAN